MKISALIFSAFLASESVDAACPFVEGDGKNAGNLRLPKGHPGASASEVEHHKPVDLTDRVRFKIPQGFRKGGRRGRSLAEDGADFVYSNHRHGDGETIPEGGYAAVREEIKNAILTTSQDYWPADFDPPAGPNYGGLMIRLAWHCNGSYRTSDGRGGCDGGNIRFAPEANWPDNGSLDVALELLKPVKEKFGDSLSWGDLIVLAGDTAIETMGGPVIGFCGGRVDNENGDESIPLGPSQLQHDLMPCGEQICPVDQICPGCEEPLGTHAVGLIYVNPEGPPDGHGDFVKSAESIREVFGRMGFDDRLSVSVIGGGHAFGKTHGACPQPETGAGFCPDTNNTWQDKFTSGLEVTWTTIPTTWSNQFFANLFNFEWTNTTSPAGAIQWEPADENAPNIGMLTTDLALAKGDAAYEELSRAYAADLDLLTKDFGEAWYQLMARDMGPRSRCLGDELPAELQPWEDGLGMTPKSELPDYIPVRAMIQESLIDADAANIAHLANLAVQCSTTFRHTDYRGGCNGAAIRFSPQIDWEVNAGVADTLELLEPIQEAHPEVSMADLIVLAGQTALEAAGGKAMPFCGGRVDAEDGSKSEDLEPRVYNNKVYDSFVYNTGNKGMSLSEGVALLATPKDGSTTLSHQFFADLKESVTAVERQADAAEEAAVSPHAFLLEGDLAPIVESFIADNDLFLAEYAKAFTYLVTADMFDGPNGNACEGVKMPTLEGETMMMDDHDDHDDHAGHDHDHDSHDHAEEEEAAGSEDAAASEDAGASSGIRFSYGVATILGAVVALFV